MVLTEDSRLLDLAINHFLTEAAETACCACNVRHGSKAALLLVKLIDLLCTGLCADHTWEHPVTSALAKNLRCLFGRLPALDFANALGAVTQQSTC